MNEKLIEMSDREQRVYNIVSYSAGLNQSQSFNGNELCVIAQSMGELSMRRAKARREIGWSVSPKYYEALYDSSGVERISLDRLRKLVEADADERHDQHL